jgi:hypothetical protein
MKLKTYDKAFKEHAVKLVACERQVCARGCRRDTLMWLRCSFDNDGFGGQDQETRKPDKKCNRRYPTEHWTFYDKAKHEKNEQPQRHVSQPKHRRR